MNKGTGPDVKEEMDDARRRELLGRAQRGDAESFAELFEAMRPRIHAVARRLVGETDAEDVVMDTYLKAWRSLPSFNQLSALGTWLYRIANNCALDALRAGKRRNARICPMPADEDAGRVGLEDLPDARQRGPDEQVAYQEEAALVNVALVGLSAEHRATLLLRFADGLAYSEIAAATGVSIGTVMSRIFHGRRKLMKAVREMGILPTGAGSAGLIPESEDSVEGGVA